MVDGLLRRRHDPRHEGVLVRLEARLERAAGPDDEVLRGPLDVRVGPDVADMADLVLLRPGRGHLARGRSAGRRVVEGAPALVVEIAASWTRVRELGARRTRYMRAGVGEFWFVDADAVVIQRDDGSIDVVRGDAVLRSSVLPELRATAGALLRP